MVGPKNAGVAEGAEDLQGASSKRARFVRVGVGVHLAAAAAAAGDFAATAALLLRPDEMMIRSADTRTKRCSKGKSPDRCANLGRELAQSGI